MGVSENGSLKRQIGTAAAVGLGLGLGSMLGTGVFVSLGLGAALAGAGVLWAVFLAGVLAMCNGLSSAQLAAAFPRSGGTYEYAHRVGWPAAGAAAGFLFLVAKSASAATAALGLAGYLLTPLGRDALVIPAALAVLACLGVMVLEGVRRTSQVNAVIVGVTLLGLTALIVGCFVNRGVAPLIEIDAAAKPTSGRWRGVAEAAALMFVAYTGYGRIATLGEEVRAPRTTIPKAIILTVGICLLLYLGTAAAALATVGPDAFAQLARQNDAPLTAVAGAAGLPPIVVWLVSIAAVTAMLGVILNLILGLSRVALAMGRRRHLPRRLARVDEATATPGPAVLAATTLIAVLICLGSIEAAWSLSAVTVLIYYALTNAAALRLPARRRLYPRVIAWLGLVGCLSLSLWIDWPYWIAAGALLAAALGWHHLRPAAADAP